MKPLVELPTLGGETEARGINDAGQVVGYCHPATGRTPVAWNDGEIVGYGTYGGLSRAFLMTPPPPPAVPTVSSWSALVLVLVLLCAASIVVTPRKRGVCTSPGKAPGHE